jgi:hypothetical protein
MMDERNIRLIALIAVVLSFVALFIFLLTAEVPIATVGMLQEDDVGNDVFIKGTIGRVSGNGKVLFLSIKHSCFADVVYFVDGKQVPEEGQGVQVLVRREEYAGKEQFVAHRIEFDTSK